MASETENLMPVVSSVVEAPPSSSTADVQAQDVVPASAMPVTVEDPQQQQPPAASSTLPIAEDDSIKVEKLVVAAPAKETPKRRLDLVCVLRECDRDEQDDAYAECLSDIMAVLERKLKKKREAAKKKE